MIRLPAYLSRSRHGIFYFRLPLPLPPNAERRSLRLSLRTRCPRNASCLSRSLITYWEQTRHRTAWESMRYEDIRKHVQELLEAALERRIAQMQERGPETVFASPAAATTRDLLEEGAEAYWHTLGQEGQQRALKMFAAHRSLSEADVMANSKRILAELHRGLVAFTAELDRRKKNLSNYDFADAESAPVEKEDDKLRTIGGESLESVVRAYLLENRQIGAWASRTFAKKESTLQCLIELLGPNLPVSTLSKRHAQDVKAVLLELPLNKSKHPITRNLSLREAAKVAGLEKISVETVNDYISILHTFNDWALRNGYTSNNVFAGMKVTRRRSHASADAARLAFPPEAISAMVAELISPQSQLVKNPSYRWASLLGIFTGARLNEICSLLKSDIVEIDGIWCISINGDDSTGRKSLKTSASKRTIPIHSRLKEAGFLAYVESIRQVGDEARLFPDFSYTKGFGFGRNQGRWFNERFLPGLGIKTKQLVFHSLRHTVVTRLLQADVEEPIVKALVGHEREGVTQQVYFSGGYPNLRCGIESSLRGDPRIISQQQVFIVVV